MILTPGKAFRYSQYSGKELTHSSCSDEPTKSTAIRDVRSSTVAEALGGLIPLLAYWQYDALQLTALESIGLAPTATPFAAERAQSAFDSLAAGEIADANSYFAIAVTQQPENVDYLYEYGLSLIELEEIEQAQAVGDQIIELASDDPRGYSLRASTMVWSDAAASIPVAVTGLERDPEFAPLHAALAIAYTNIGRYQEGLARGAL